MSHMGFFVKYLLIMCVYVHECMCDTCEQVPQRPGEGTGSPETAVIVGYEPLCRCW